MNHFMRVGPFQLESQEGLYFYFLLNEHRDPVLLGMDSLEEASQLLMKRFREAVAGGEPASAWTYDPRLPYPEPVQSALKSLGFLPAPTPTWAAEDHALLVLALLLFAGDTTAEPLLSTRGTLGRFVRSAIQLARIRQDSVRTSEPLRLDDNGALAGIARVESSGDELLTLHFKPSWLKSLLTRTVKKNGLTWRDSPDLVVQWEEPPADVKERAEAFLRFFNVDALPVPSVWRSSLRPVRPQELELMTDALEAACALWAPGSLPQAKPQMKLSPV